MDDMTGANWTTLGGPSGGSGTGQFTTPAGIALDTNGRISVADSGNNRIVRMDNISGSGWAAFGSLGSGVDQFNSPL
jgi:DNA-binding beta-propeller fold protein YncE